HKYMLRIMMRNNNNNNVAFMTLLLLLLLSLLHAEAAIGNGEYEAQPPQSSPEEYSKAAGEASAPESTNIRKLGRHRSWSDKSMAGGGVIIGGLVTAIFAALFCYIRVTRRKGHADDDHGYYCNNNCSK
ncbi:hypothetical protein PIB30_047345, partial [Stylosanthes scabra]|nr:hypothetical protein [Stylosanthes scabra]